MSDRKYCIKKRVHLIEYKYCENCHYDREENPKLRDEIVTIYEPIDNFEEFMKKYYLYINPDMSLKKSYPNYKHLDYETYLREEEGKNYIEDCDAYHDEKWVYGGVALPEIDYQFKYLDAFIVPDEKYMVYMRNFEQDFGKDFEIH